MVTAAQQRTATLKVNLHPTIYERLKLLAERQGVPAAVLGAVAVGQYVSAHMANLDAQQQMQKACMDMLERLPQQLLELERRE